MLLCAIFILTRFLCYIFGGDPNQSNVHNGTPQTVATGRLPASEGTKLFAHFDSHFPLLFLRDRAFAWSERNRQRQRKGRRRELIRLSPSQVGAKNFAIPNATRWMHTARARVCVYGVSMIRRRVVSWVRDLCCCTTANRQPIEEKREQNGCCFTFLSVRLIVMLSDYNRILQCARAIASERRKVVES